MTLKAQICLCIHIFIHNVSSIMWQSAGTFCHSAPQANTQQTYTYRFCKLSHSLSLHSRSSHLLLRICIDTKSILNARRWYDSAKQDNTHKHTCIDSARSQTFLISMGAHFCMSIFLWFQKHLGGNVLVYTAVPRNMTTPNKRVCRCCKLSHKVLASMDFRSSHIVFDFHRHRTYLGGN